jgi:hypothetical protein
MQILGTLTPSDTAANAVVEKVFSVMLCNVLLDIQSDCATLTQAPSNGCCPEPNTDPLITMWYIGGQLSNVLGRVPLMLLFLHSKATLTIPY